MRSQTIRHSGVELLGEIEARAILAAAGDQEALNRLELLIRELRRLSQEAAAQTRDQSEDEREE